METERVMLGAGCFWGVQYQFQKLNSAIKTQVGYKGGKKKYKNSDENVNCLFTPCIKLIDNFPYYTYVWIVIIFFNIFISAFLINNFINYFELVEEKV